MRPDVPASASRIALLVLVVGLLTLAGCTGGNGTGTTTGDPANATTSRIDTALETTTATGGVTTTTSGPVGGTTTGSDTTTTTGPSGNGTVDIARRHVSGLNAAGSFTALVRVETSAVLDGERVNRTVVRTIAVDLEARRGLVTQRIDSTADDPLRTARYTEGNVTYRRVGSPGSEPRYERDEAPYDGDVRPARAAVDRTNSFVVVPAEWTRDGIGILDGTAVRKYTANGTGSFGVDSDRFTDHSLQRVTSINATALVDSSGVVRRIRLLLSGVDADGNRYTQSRRLAITEIGSTSVSRPVWLSAARNSTDEGV